MDERFPCVSNLEDRGGLFAGGGLYGFSIGKARLDLSKHFDALPGLIGGENSLTFGFGFLPVCDRVAVFIL